MPKKKGGGIETIFPGKPDMTFCVLQKTKNVHFEDTEKRLLVGTFNSEILVFEGHEFKGAFETGTALPIVSIQCTAKGFVCGCDTGVLLCFEKGGEKQL